MSTTSTPETTKIDTESVATIPQWSTTTTTAITSPQNTRPDVDPNITLPSTTNNDYNTPPKPDETDQHRHSIGSATMATPSPASPSSHPASPRRTRSESSASHTPRLNPFDADDFCSVEMALGVEHLEKREEEREARMIFARDAEAGSPTPDDADRHRHGSGSSNAPQLGPLDWIAGGGSVAPLPTPPIHPQSRAGGLEPSGRDKNGGFARFLTPLRQKPMTTQRTASPNPNSTSHHPAPSISSSSSPIDPVFPTVKPLVYGYLHKRTRNGVWQRRFFETDGECLTYFKTQKRAKLLATLDLVKVGAITVDDTDLAGCTFTIQVAGRPYALRADDSATCKDWVINLNRVREARIQIGGIKLVAPHFEEERMRKRTESTEYAARIVMVANRERSHAIDDGDNDDCLKQIIITAGSNDSSQDNLGYNTDCDMPGVDVDVRASSPEVELLATPTESKKGIRLSVRSPRLSTHLPPQIYASWRKPRSNLFQINSRLRRFFQWVNKVRCISKAHDDVISVVQDDHFQRVNTSQSNSTAMEDINEASDVSTASTPNKHQNTAAQDAHSHMEWIGKEQRIEQTGGTPVQKKKRLSLPNMSMSISSSFKRRIPEKVSMDEAARTIS